MNKKTIILVLIAILILNTFYWINLIASIEGSSGYTFSENLRASLTRWNLSKGIVSILIITDAVLIAIFFMIILLYKKE